MPTDPGADQQPEIPDLIEAARNGSEEALGQLMQTCRSYLLLVANRELESRYQREISGSDLVQETFVEAQRDFKQFRGNTEAEILAWTRQILLNNLANFVRKQGKAGKDRPRDVSINPTGSGSGLQIDLPADIRTPSGWVMADEQRQAVEAALGALPQQYQQVILLRHREQLSFAAVGGQLNRSAEAARKLWARAIERLQRELETRL